MFTHAVTAILILSLGQTPPGSSKETGTPPPAKPTTQKAEKKAEKKTDKQGKKDSKDSRRSAAPANLAVKAMNMVVEDAEFKDMTFEDFVEWLGRTSKANVVVRWKVLEKEGIERDHPVTLKEKNIKMGKLLAKVFDQVTADLRSVELAAKADGNTLMISTKQELNMQLVTKVYDVQDLLLNIPDFTGSEMGEVGTLTADHYKKGGGAVSKKGSGGNNEGAGGEDPSEQLIRTITTHIQPLSWKVNGGKGTIKIYKGQLVIRNNMEVHQQLGGYLGVKTEQKEPAGKE
jgi:hypothetical protein